MVYSDISWIVKTLLKHHCKSVNHRKQIKSSTTKTYRGSVSRVLKKMKPEKMKTKSKTKSETQICNFFLYILLTGIL